ncbi:unnamed protein product [Linum tenue]|uniref:Protein PAM68, chloroplastic n=1 Tax=Linum tenue TaxID=586396 RepID=A0AAV0KEZ4_9ROSI|nr:unnamed protein product [Linum tenue]
MKLVSSASALLSAATPTSFPHKTDQISELAAVTTFHQSFSRGSVPNTRTSRRCNPWSLSSSAAPFLLYATKNPRGFGRAVPSKKTSKSKKKPKTLTYEDDEDEDGGDGQEESSRDSDDVIPEIVTNRMINRMGLSVGIPLFVGLLFFPFFYYLKVGLKIDVPTWVPFIVSFFFFGSALLGVTYGIVSSSWDPLREGSLLGWTEAQKNWPVFWSSIWGNRSSGNK